MIDILVQVLHMDELLGLLYKIMGGKVNVLHINLYGSKISPLEDS